MDFLEKIIFNKKNEIEDLKRQKPLDILKKDLDSVSFKRRSLKNSLLSKCPGIIAEIKRKSPSKGELREIKDSSVLAGQYAESGAAAISILTDKTFFDGSIEDLRKIRKVVDIPVLRKDFIIDPYQLYETKLAGADAVLLISSALTHRQISDLYNLAADIELEVLLETECEEDINKINGIDIEIIGVNNRNLHTFEQSLETSFKLAPLLPSKAVKVSESSISTPGQIVDLYKSGFRGFLIGETLMRSENPGETLKSIINESNSAL